ncbi:MAG TPA: hypothetical protein G4O11_07985 [Anaerolineae bacterium]|nr:hypothetical protein [Anaerolineae bacterium]
MTKAKSGEQGKLWILPPLMAVWSNLHGGFAIGFMLIGAYLLGELIEFVLIERNRRQSCIEVVRGHRVWTRTLLIIALACVVAVAFNPQGLQMLIYPFKTVSVGVLQDYIEEWQSPDFHRLEVQPFLWMLMLTIVALALSREKKRAVDLLFVVGFASLSLLAARNIATFALVAAPVFARHSYAAVEPLLKRWMPGPNLREKIARRINLVLFALLALAALIKIALPLNDQINQEAVSKQVPVDAVAFLHEHPDLGPLYNSYNWGGYVIWALYPDHLSFVDGRTDLFGDEILEDYLAAWRAEPGWQHILDQWGIRIALLEPYAPLAFALEQAGWALLYEDEQAIIYGKD